MHPSVHRASAVPPAAVRAAAAALPASRIGEVASLGLGDPSAIPLWYGESDLATPAFVCDAAAAAMRAGETFYTFRRGTPAFREALSAYLSALHARPTPPEATLATSSGMSAIMLACQALLDPGDSVVVVTPVWPNVEAAIRTVGGAPRPAPLDRTADGGWSLDLGRLEDACDGRTRAIFVNSPSNPTGWTATADELAETLAIARRRGLWLISDEVYSRIVYGRRAAPSVLDVAGPEDRVLVVGSFSKAWAMTGWRLGWMTAPADVHPVLEKLIEINTTGAPTFLQPAGVAALREGEPFVAAMVERCRVGRDVVLGALRRFPRVRVAEPAGAFYAFFALEGMTDSLAFAKEALLRRRVGLAPGSAFGPAGEGFLRICFARDAGQLGEAMERLAPMLA